MEVTGYVFDVRKANKKTKRIEGEKVTTKITEKQTTQQKKDYECQQEFELFIKFSEEEKVISDTDKKARFEKWKEKR